MHTVYLNKFQLYITSDITTSTIQNANGNTAKTEQFPSNKFVHHYIYVDIQILLSFSINSV